MIRNAKSAKGGFLLAGAKVIILHGEEVAPDDENEPWEGANFYANEPRR